MEHDNRQRCEPRLEDICPGCGAPDRFSCRCAEIKVPLGKQPYKIAISREELEVAVHHRAATGEPIQTFIRRLIRQSSEARGFRQLMLYGETDDPRYRARSGSLVTKRGAQSRSVTPPQPDGATP